ncbi:methionyl-tRNA formyltransferase [bacterium]|nr:methionyl-tRNA formyltransferase [bacterium]
MGTPDFAVETLDAIRQSSHEVVAVVTAADKPAGRGQKLSESAVKQYAVAHGLPLLQPEKLRNEGFIEQLKSYHADVFVVAAFRMLPEVVWSIPARGTLNLHASLLPKYRGAAPINHAIINGETESGVTTFFIEHQIDTGEIILQEKVAIGADETAGELHDKLMETGAALVVKTLDLIAADAVQTHAQQFSGEIPLAPKIFREDCRIDWRQPLAAIYNKIRGLSPYPGAWTTLNGKTFKLLKVKKEQIEHPLQAGTMQADKDLLKVAAEGGFILVEALQLEGKKRMNAAEFLRGYEVNGLILGS